MTKTAPALMVKSDYFDIPLRMVSGSVEHPIYSNLLDAVADKIKTKIKNDGQFVLVITGGTGSGKSNLALQLIKTLDPNFRFEDVYLYEPEDFAKKLQSGINQPINWFDEAIIMFNSLNVMSTGGRLMGPFFDTMRLEHYISILCLPADREIDSRVLKHMDMLIKCPSKSPLPKWADYSPRGFFKVVHRITYDSGKHYDKDEGTGYVRLVPKKLKTEYDTIKKAHSEKYKRKMIEKLLK